MRIKDWIGMIRLALLAFALATAGIPGASMAMPSDAAKSMSHHHGDDGVQAHNDCCPAGQPGDASSVDHDSCCCLGTACSYSLNVADVAETARLDISSALRPAGSSGLPQPAPSPLIHPPRF